MTDYLIKRWQNQGKLNGKQFVASTIVSTDMISKIASSYGVENKICLTGFKWIAKLIKDSKNLILLEEERKVSDICLEIL